METTTTTRRLVRMAQLEQYCGCNRSSVYRWQESRGFPQPFLKSATSSVYDLDEVDRWIESQREAQRD